MVSHLIPIEGDGLRGLCPSRTASGPVVRVCWLGDCRGVVSVHVYEQGRSEGAGFGTPLVSDEAVPRGPERRLRALSFAALRRARRLHGRAYAGAGRAPGHARAVLARA